MSYVLHVYRMTYKTYDMQEYIFVHPEEWHSRKTHSSGFFSFSSFSIKKMSRSLEALRLQPLGRTTAVFSMVLGFILAKTLCPQRHSKVCFELLETFWVTPKDLAINGCISLQSWEIIKTLFYNTCFVRFTLLVLQCRHTLFPSVDSYTWRYWRNYR